MFTYRHEIRTRKHRHPSERRNRRTRPQQHTRKDQQVIDQAEDDPENMRALAISHFDQFKQSMRVGSPSLRLDGDEGEEADHGAGGRSPPDAQGDAVLVCEKGGAEEGGAVQPGGYHGGSGEADADAAVGDHEAIGV